MIDSIDLPSNPVFAELKRQVADPEQRADLTPLWKAAGRPRGMSPRQRYRGSHWPHEERGTGPDDPFLVERKTALIYAQLIDEDVFDAVFAVWQQALHADPAGNLLGCPNGVMGLVATGAVMEDQGVDWETARDRLIAQAVERTADLDPLTQETKIARVQRALRGEPDVKPRAD